MVRLFVRTYWTEMRAITNDFFKVWNHEPGYFPCSAPPTRAGYGQCERGLSPSIPFFLHQGQSRDTQVPGKRAHTPTSTILPGAPPDRTVTGGSGTHACGAMIVDDSPLMPASSRGRGLAVSGLGLPRSLSQTAQHSRGPPTCIPAGAHCRPWKRLGGGASRDNRDRMKGEGGMAAG